VKEHIVWDH